MTTLADFIRDTPFGQGVRWISGARLFKYPEEHPDFLLLHPSLKAAEEGRPPAENENESKSPERKEITGSPTQKSGDHTLVSWCSHDDPANPSNWSFGKKAWVHASINYYAFAIYMASSLYTPAAPELIRIWDISITVSSLGLGIFVLGYGIGPLLFGPLSEIPAIGRSWVYFVTQFLFLVLSIPTALANNAAGFMVLRFLLGLFGAPALCIAGGTIGDITTALWLPFMLYVYAFCPLAGPSLGPLIAGFSVPV
ncbi:hypothetical protein IFR04_006326 [Cadophora malorum]|uniref:Major facilitator superfamily (MFS) profile domain-containing protein n=1 Tax=Cadophora malorum TaxID=108018 RepID=A0A8H7W7L4_9HELO|nr:hypothetical protein IFR04_006326 [Cadophora malorum]